MYAFSQLIRNTGSYRIGPDIAWLGVGCHYDLQNIFDVAARRIEASTSGATPPSGRLVQEDAYDGVEHSYGSLTLFT